MQIIPTLKLPSSVVLSNSNAMQVSSLAPALQTRAVSLSRHACPLRGSNYSSSLRYTRRTLTSPCARPVASLSSESVLRAEFRINSAR